MDHVSDTSHSSPEAAYPLPPNAARHAAGRARADRPCDSCRKRKSRCVKDAEQTKCVLCTFHQRECTYLEEPQRRKRKRDHEAGPAPSHALPVEGAPAQLPRADIAERPGHGDRGGPSLLDRTLGLHRSTHSRYTGTSSLLGSLAQHIGPRSRPPPGDDGVGLRRVDPSALFVVYHDHDTPTTWGDHKDCDSIEQIVGLHGPALVDLYFRIVHPSYPILHKGVFLEKYARSYKEFSPPLLAAVYLLAMDWWEYDSELAFHPKPDADMLVQAATKAMTAVIHRPKLSTIQAGLLLLQRSGGDSWVLASQLVAVAEELGLHVDCSSWNIPHWEKGLRRRLSWAIFMQDKWGALIHGRPSHVSSANWQSRRLTLDDFPESAADQNDKEGSTEVEQGRRLFIQLASLTEIMSETLELLHGPDRSRSRTVLSSQGMFGFLNLVKPIAVSLKAWASNMPADLRLDHVSTRKLCSTGYLHLSYFAAEIMIHCQIIQDLEADAEPDLVNVCRQAAESRLDHAMAFFETLRPEHLQGFWWFASSKCLALIGVYAALLWATSPSESEAQNYKQKLHNFRWSLKVRAKSSTFVTIAMRELDETLGSLEMDRRPTAQTRSTPAGHIQQRHAPTEGDLESPQTQSSQTGNSLEAMSQPQEEVDGELHITAPTGLSSVGDVSPSFFAGLGDFSMGIWESEIT